MTPKEKALLYERGNRMIEHQQEVKMYEEIKKDVPSAIANNPCNCRLTPDQLCRAIGCSGSKELTLRWLVEHTRASHDS